MGGATAMRASTTSTTRAEVAELTGANISPGLLCLYEARSVRFSPAGTQLFCAASPLVALHAGARGARQEHHVRHA